MPYTDEQRRKVAEAHARRLTRLRTERSQFDRHWRVIAQYLLPRRQRFDPSDRWRSGTRRNTSIINNTGTRAVTTLSAFLLNAMSSPAKPWFKLRISDPEMNKRRNVRIWLDDTERRMRDVFASSNFYDMASQVYRDLPAFGTSAMVIEDHAEDVIDCHCYPVGSYYVACDDHYRPNSVYRETTLTVEQCVKKFGIDDVSAHIKTLYERNAYDEIITVLHAIEPAELVEANRSDYRGMPVRSTWLEWGSQGTGTFGGQHGNLVGAQHLLGEGGYWEFPVMIPRWEPTGEDVYGASPGMVALEDIIALQVLEKKKARALEKIVDPPMAGFGMSDRRANLVAGGMNYLDSAAGTFKPAHVVDPRALQVNEEIDRHERRINSAFYNDLILALLQGPTRQITAREVDERSQEKMLQLGSALLRIQKSFLSPSIKRTFAIMTRRGVLLEQPREIADTDFTIEYVSPLAQAQKLIGVASLDRLMMFVQGAAATHPESVDKLDFDNLIDHYARDVGAPETVIRSERDVEQIRQDRMQQAMAQRDQAAAMRDAAAAAKTAGETDVDGLREMASMLGVA